jgi:hypothetical protein
MGTKSRAGSGMNILDHVSESLETIFGLKILKFFGADSDPGIFLTLDPGWKNSDPGSGINIPDPQHCQEGTILTDGKINLFLLKSIYLAGHEICINSISFGS